MWKRPALVCALALSGVPAFGDDARPARVYTNEDLDRVAPRRGETGVLSHPQSPPAPRGASREAAADRRIPSAKGQDYWQREASRVRARVRTLREQARRLRERNELEADRSSRARRRSGGAREAWAAADDRARRLGELEARAREMESDLEDRARRAGVPPGWLR
jgi:hypothetical protein